MKTEKFLAVIKTIDILHNTNLFFKKTDVKSLQSWTFYMSVFHLNS